MSLFMLSVLIRYCVGFCFFFLQAVAAKLDLPEDFIGYFSLFLIRESVDGGVTCESAETSLLSFLAIMVFFPD